MAADLQAISQLLQASLDPSQNKQAEAALKEKESQPGYSLSLLHIVASQDSPATIRLASALAFKNFIKRNWTDVEGNYKLPQDEVTTIKSELVGLMASVPPTIQTQLGEVISVIADSDFWERWDTLVDDLVSRLTPDNAATNTGVLQVAHSIFKRWRPLFRTDELYTEINHVLSRFGTPFLALLENTDQAITASQNDKTVLKSWFTTLNLELRILYDLSCHDLPPVFEDNLPALTSLLHKYLTYDSALLHSDDDDESGPLEYTRSAILEVIALFIDKYEDVFSSYLPQFIESAWQILTNIGPETKYDVMVSKALQFLTSVCKRPGPAATFNNEDTLGQVVEKVILPNLALREADTELFEDEPIEFVRRDLEGSDADTRRRAATDFLRTLMEQFEELVTRVVMKYIDHFLADYNKDKADNWKSKDTAVYLFCSIAAKGTPTAAFGVKTINPHVNVLDFFQNNIASDLTANDIHPVLQVDSIKYIYVFRSQLTPQLWRAAFPLLVNHLASSNYVIYTYAAIAVERALYLTTEDKQPIISTNDIVASSKDLLSHLFNLIRKQSAPEKVQENEFLMRCVMRVLIVIKEGVMPNLNMVLQSLNTITMVIRHNPSNPRFYYFHFEAIGALIKYCAPTHPEPMEKALYEPFAAILSADVQEFAPYVFQLFAALLEANPSGTLSEFYQGLIQPVLMPSNWESKGNVPALVRLLSAIIPRGVQFMMQNNLLIQVLGIFQKLVSTKAHESNAFDLIETIITNFPPEALEQYWQPMVQIMLTRLSNSKTENFELRFTRFYHMFSSRLEQGLGADKFIAITDQIQHDVYKPIYLTVILPSTQKLTRPVDRKLAVVSLTKTLTSSEAFDQRYKKGWTLTCDALLKLLINPPNVTSAQAESHAAVEQDVDDPSFGVGFTQLNTCRRGLRDAYPEISDVKVWVSTYLKQKNVETNNRVAQFVSERLSADSKTALGQLMS